jgi:hypothetical protein
MSSQSTQSRTRPLKLMRAFGLQGLVIVVTLIIAELILHALNVPYLRADDWGSLHYRYDAELGWSPVPNSHSASALPREIDVSHNSLGVRDREFRKSAQPAMLFIGDSFTWGYNVEAAERFSDLLRARLNYNVLNAGVSGYGTDQAFLLLKRLWNDVEPSVVVLMFCVENDHTDNSRNMRYFNYKPYLQASADGGWEFRGQPPPKPRKSRFQESWLARHLILARLAISAYVELAYPRVTVPDPTEPLITMLRQHVEQHGAKLLVGLQEADPPLEAFLQRQGIPFARFDGAEYYDSSRHWTPAGHALVAERLAELFATQNISLAAPAGSAATR